MTKRGSQLAAALADRKPLGEYEGQDVIRTSVALRKAGDGLSKSIAIEPAKLRIGSKVFVLVECTVGPHKHVPIEDTDCLELKQDLIADTCSMVDADFAAEKIEEQKLALKRATDEATGQQSTDDPLYGEIDEATG